MPVSLKLIFVSCQFRVKPLTTVAGPLPKSPVYNAVVPLNVSRLTTLASFESYRTEIHG